MKTRYKILLGVFLVLFGFLIFVIGFSLIFYPQWLGLNNWPTSLLSQIGIAGLVLVAEWIIGKLLDSIFGIKLVRAWFIYKFGDNYVALKRKADNFTRTQIGKEKNSKKYIPNVFIETIEAKEKLRYFSEPERFYAKIVNQSQKEVSGFTLIATLKRIGYPVPTLAFPRMNKPSELEKVCREAIQNLNEYINPSEIFIKEVELKPEHYEKIPLEKRYLYHYLRYNLQYHMLYQARIDNSKESFHLLTANTLLITGRAGNGKTNLVCDFVENFLLKKNSICLYFTGRDFDQIGDSETIEEAISKIMFSDEFSFSDLMYLIRFDKNQDRLFIIIDGINENKNLAHFAQSLQQFIQRNIGNNIKLLLTCRSEYFEERFGNLKHLESVSIVRMDRYKIPNSHLDYLIESYFNFFNIKTNVSNVSEDVRKIFAEDKLMLRFFCEAYQGEPNFHQLSDLYRLEVFSKYMDKKVANIRGLEDCLLEITCYMVANRVFNNLSLQAMSEKTRQVAENATYENVILRKDIVELPNTAFGKQEVINFVYDEFREFLLASYLIKLWEKVKEQVKPVVEAFTKERSQIAEGLQKYLCLWAIKNRDNELLEFLSGFEFFDQVFIRSIFGSPDVYITRYELEKLEELFWKNAWQAMSIFSKLVFRCNPEAFPNLNVSFWFNQIKKMDDEQYQGIVVAKLLEEYDYHKSYLDSLCDNINKAFNEGRVSIGSRKKLLQVLAFLFGVKDNKWMQRETDFGKFPALYVFNNVTLEMDQEEIISLLQECLETNVKFLSRMISNRIVELGGEL